MLNPVRVAAHASGALSFAVVLVILSTFVVACGSDGAVELAAVDLDNGEFGTLLVSSEGEQLLPVVTRNDLNAVTQVTGAMWLDANGSSAYVEIDPATGLPSMTVFGDFILIFSNWSADHTTADVARIYGPTGYAEILRGINVWEGEQQVAGEVSSAATCLGSGCPSKERTQAEMLKVAGLAMSIGMCGFATAASWGAALLPCSGVVVSAAKLALGEESWLNAPVERAGKLLMAVDVLQCISGDVSGCVSLALDRASDERAKAATREETYQAMVQDAESRLMIGDQFSGVYAGEAPQCMNSYQCTPGLTLNCIEGGTKTCQPDCVWGACPKIGSGPCGLAQSGDEVCKDLMKGVEAQCSAAGGHIVGWTQGKAACVSAFNCWKNTCPCLLSCSLQCADDYSCTDNCITAAGSNIQAEAAACSACEQPQVEGQCGSGG